MGEASHHLLAVAGRPEGVAAWRTDRLLAAGLGEASARALGADRAVDLHALLELLDRGCAPELARRIVAPLEDERRAS